MNKAEWNAVIDAAIGLALLVSTVSGLALLLPGDATTSILGLGFRAWSGVHTWSSLAMVAGVYGHLALHARWIMGMARKLFRRAPVAARRPQMEREAR